MNPHTTLEKMRAMRLKAMAEHHHHPLDPNVCRQVTIYEVLATLIDTEWEARQQRKIAGLIKRAGCRQQAAATDFDHPPARGFDKTLLGRLLSLNFIKNAEKL